MFLVKCVITNGLTCMSLCFGCFINSGTRTPASYTFVRPFGKGIPLSDVKTIKESSNSPADFNSFMINPTPAKILLLLIIQQLCNIKIECRIVLFILTCWRKMIQYCKHVYLLQTSLYMHMKKNLKKFLKIQISANFLFHLTLSVQLKLPNYIILYPCNQLLHV